MSKVGKKSHRKDNEAIAKARYIKGSERKLNLLAQLIRGKSAQRALVDLEFARRRMAVDVKKVLEAAIANAENNHNLDVDRLFVKEATVGRTMTMGRFHARGRGRSAAVEKPFSNITIIVEERAEGEDKKKAKAAKKAAKAEAGDKPAKKSGGAKAAKKPAAKAKAAAGENTTAE
ncbi:MAG TPA: 50S ribosomal protein L22 [Alphaproteobacteria bacterium]|nr:50S ribosomal protein L22 [Alphaproteobacteria bacterium]HCS23554.1 50S ribosomal protein L22 [Rhodospirillaceae bacterium]HRI76552.1 50S ribosomal protein L22 [Alphaproteobacteria bacterium]HRJ65844.1 50S ribosomal protein L22 [Alphaproteobacteria bacterium]